MTVEEAKRLGQKARKEIVKLDARLTDWEILKRTFGFYQFKKKHNLDETFVEAFGEGFNNPDAKL